MVRSKLCAKNVKSATTVGRCTNLLFRGLSRFLCGAVMSGARESRSARGGGTSGTNMAAGVSFYPVLLLLYLVLPRMLLIAMRHDNRICVNFFSSLFCSFFWWGGEES